MIELIKKAMFTGIGVAALTKDKVEELAGEFVEQGKLSEAEGKKLVDEIMDRSKESQEELNQKIETMVQAAVAKLDIAKASEIEALKEEIRELRSTVSTAE